MMTGGALGMIKPGGGQKTLARVGRECVEVLSRTCVRGLCGVSRSLVELIAQYFPGSNIDAWFEVQGVPQDMREYWWAYALNKAQAVLEACTRMPTRSVTILAAPRIVCINVSRRRRQ